MKILWCHKSQPESCSLSASDNQVACCAYTCRDCIRRPLLPLALAVSWRLCATTVRGSQAPSLVRPACGTGVPAHQYNLLPLL